MDRISKSVGDRSSVVPGYVGNRRRRGQPQGTKGNTPAKTPYRFSVALADGGHDDRREASQPHLCVKARGAGYGDIFDL